jgi:hypothetical protein
VKCVVLLALTALIPVCGFSQQERWVYRYSGVANWRGDYANSVVFGPDSNVYAAGYSWQNATEDDFTVISLTSTGAERWVYTYNGLDDSHDQAYSTILGIDGNVYAVGSCYASDTTRDFTVISLTPTGTERWVYQHGGSGGGPDYAYDVCYGYDGNIYAVGSSWSINSNTDFTVASITDSGTERWVYTYNGPANYNDCARSITLGSDGNVYAVGESYGDYDDFTVISLTTTGTERWVYRYNGPGNWADYANTVVCDLDGNVYVTGSTTGLYGFDITIICFDSSGTDQWIYRHPENYFDDCGYDGILGSDDNLYVAGIFGSDVPDLMVVSTTDSGGPRWEYVHYTPTITFEAGMSIAFGDGHIYVAGQVADAGDDIDFTIICLDSLGTEYWVYQYDSYGANGCAFSITYGSDGNIYAAGMTTDSITGQDFTVISLFAGPGIPENNERFAINQILQVAPNPFDHTTRIRYSILDTRFLIQDPTISIYDATGCLVRSFNSGSGIENHASEVMWDGRDDTNRQLPSGVYFVRLRTPDYTETKKVVLLD